MLKTHTDPKSCPFIALFMNFLPVLVLRIALTLLSAVPAAADETRVIHIQADGVPRFDVVYHRARTNSIGVAVAGLVGAGVQAGIESDRDARKRSEIEPHLSQDIWNDAFVGTLDEALREKGFEPVWLQEGSQAGAAKADIYLVMFPESYGFRMVQSTAKLVSAYVDFSTIYAREPVRSRKKAARETFYLTDNKQVSYEELMQETSTLNAELESVLRQAARRLANKIAYNLE